MSLKWVLFSAVAIALAAIALVTVGNVNHSPAQTVIPNGGKAYDA